MFKRIYSLLSDTERRKCIKVGFTVFLNSLLDLVGLAALFPALIFIFGDVQDSHMAVMCCLIAMLIVLAKNLVIIALVQYRNKFLLSIYERTSLGLFLNYYNRGLLFLRANNPVSLGFDVTYTCYDFAFGVLSPIIRMFSEMLFIVMVTVLLLCYKPMMVALLYAAFVPFAAAYIWGIRKRLRKYGEMATKERRAQNRRVTEALSGYAQLELNEAIGSISRAVEEGLRRISDIRVKLETLQYLPSGFSDFAVVAALAVLVAIGGEASDLKTTIGIFGIVAIRLLPALRGVIQCWSEVQDSSYSIDIISEMRQQQTGYVEEHAEGVMPFNNSICINNISYTYPDGKEVLKDFSCEIRRGEYIGIRGESGIGKTTLFNLLLGFIRPDSGTITIDSTELTQSNRKQWQRHIGYVSQETFLIDGTIAENIALGLDNYDREKIIDALRRVNFPIDEMPDGIDTKIVTQGGRLSGGQRQRLAIARALYKDVDILLLDEATSALDSESELAINSMIRNLRDMTVLVITHRESALHHCDRVITLKID